jgi:dihydrofolate synthase/folylpolyglutamate synthase
MPDSRRPSLARLESLDLRGIKLGLAPIDEACARLGRPERAVASVLVAGTNGKGSTAATLASIAGAVGMRAGLYTSPHLESVTERIRVGADDIAADELDARLAEVFAAADRAPALPLTYFEAMTAAAFVTFARRGLDLAVLEVGLGGRLDATNVAPAAVSIVTAIGLDHVEDLGPTLESIAGEKAGIFRSGRPALTVSREPGVRAVFRDAASRIGAALHELPVETRVEVRRSGLEGSRFRLQTPHRAYELETPLPGRHQIENAAVAVRAAEFLRPKLDPEAVAQGVASVRWPGRLEAFGFRGTTVLLDGCHNAAGAGALAAFLASTRIRPDLVFGAMADKDVESMAAALGPAVGRIRLVSLASPRAATAEELARRFGAARPDAAPSSGLAEALEELLSAPRPESIIVAGSLYLIGEARTLLAGRGDKR